MSNDGPRPVETYKERLGREITEEEKFWEEAGIPHPSQGYGTDLFMLACRLEALYHLVIDRGLATIEQIDTMVLERILENMKEMRKQIEPQVQEARRQSIVVKEMPPELK